VKVSPNRRGPSRKAKYSLATDSEPSSASERWEEPLSGEDSDRSLSSRLLRRLHRALLFLSVLGMLQPEERNMGYEMKMVRNPPQLVR